MANLRNKLRLSDIDRRVLTCVELAGLKNADEIAAELKVRKHVVHYSLQRLREREILGQLRAAISRSNLGLYDFTFYLVLNHNAAQFRAFLARVRANSAVTWCAEIGGEFTCAITITARSPQEAQAGLTEVLTRSESISHKSLAIRLRLHSYPRSFLHLGSGHRDALIYGSDGGVYAPDPTDIKLLEQLSAGFESFREVGRKLGVAPATVIRRVAVLQEHNVIAGFFRPIDPIKLGLSVHKLLIAFHSVNAGLRKEILDYAAKHPHVTTLIESMGAWDYEIVVESDAQPLVSSVMRELHQKFCGEVQSIHLQQILGFYKSSRFDRRWFT